MSLFIDTSAFLTILDADDPNNELATEVWAQSLRAGQTIVTTNYVVVETLSVLHRRHGLSAVRWFTDDILPVVHVDWVLRAPHDLATKSVLSGSRNGPSLVDCVSFEAIDRLGVTAVLAYDRHFDDRGFVLVGRRGD